MIEPTDNFDRNLECRLGELNEAERAGVFRASRVDPRQLMRAGGSVRSSSLRYAAAAALFLVVTSGVWTAMFQWNLSSLRQDRGSNQLATIAIGDCLAGPRGNLPSACNTYDLDSDGDVDLADLSSFQTAYAQR